MEVAQKAQVDRDLCNTKRSRSWCFTWNNYNKKDVLYILAQFNDIFEYVFQEERGDTGTVHLQGVFRRKNPMRFNEVKKMLPKCHIEPAKNFKNCVKYCSKRDTRIGKVWNNMNLKFRKSLKDPLGGNPLYKWQKELKDILDGEPDRRTIYWYYSIEGNVGKSSFLQWYYRMNKDRCIMCSGKAKDMKYLIAKREEEDVDTEVVIFDIPRTQLKYLSYTGVEEIKNGFFASTKYECSNVDMNPPHVIIMANEPPCYNALSSDRWVVKEI